ncbi:MAG TPA: glutaredoxin family protein [Methylophilaceae bacterium]|nr:glutaredoxin family protein [Methylophilaceae bacterium]
MPIRLLLYGTSACHLCEQAAALLYAVARDNHLEWAEIDIADDERLLQRYGTVIPVLRCVDNGAELHWPFTAAEIRCWLSSISIQE